MDMTIVNTGIAWAIPVRPDLLGRSLEAYNKSIKTVEALRLCNRFGTGPGAHITKLPTEVVSLIEDFVFQEKLTHTGHWQECFKHFEGRCQPMDHAYDDRYLDLRDEATDTVELCDDCTQDPGETCHRCDVKIERQMNDIADESGDWKFMFCLPQADNWPTIINQKVGGNFEKYDKLILKHFGLKVCFATTRKSRTSPESWPNHKNHRWHEYWEELRTTICYLTLPKSSTVKSSYGLSEMEADMDPGSVTIETAQSCLVSRSTILGGKKGVKQFQRALRLLKLQPYTHPSQLSDAASRGEECDEATTAKGKDKQPSAKGDNKKDLAKIKWPQLVVLVKTEHEW